MIDLKIHDCKVERFAMIGSTSTIIADTLATISLIYASLSKNNKDCERIFKELIETAVKDGLLWEVGKTIEFGDGQKDEDDIENMLSTLEKILTKKGKKK